MNALQHDGGFKLIDPDDLLAARTGLDLVAIWEWGVVERLSSGLLCTRIRLQHLGRDALAAAEAVGLMIG